MFSTLLIGQILAIRAQVEELVIDEESLAYLGEVGQQASLRYCLQFTYTIHSTLLLLPWVLKSNLNVSSGMQFNSYHLLALLLEWMVETTFARYYGCDESFDICMPMQFYQLLNGSCLTKNSSYSWLLHLFIAAIYRLIWRKWMLYI